jgi:hypothetical protein
MSSPLTPQQKKRDSFLRELARDPDEALRHWNRLNQADRSVLLDYMVKYHDQQFADDFHDEASGRKRPDLSIHISVGPNLTPAEVTKRGYRFKEKWLRHDIYVNQHGDQIWLVRPPKALEPPALVPPGAGSERPEAHPDVKEVRDYADRFGREAQRLKERARELKESKDQLPAQEYARHVRQWRKEYEEWREQITVVQEEAIPSMTGYLTPEENAAKQKELGRLNTARLEGFDLLEADMSFD